MSTFAIRNTFRDLLNTACGQLDNVSNERSKQLAIGSILGALVLAAAWGAAAGSGSASFAISSSLKVPLVVLLSLLSALPMGLLTLRLSGVQYPAGTFVLNICSGIFGGALTLAALAPIVAVYYHTSAAIGGQLALGSAFAALAVGAVVFVRNTLARIPNGVSARAISISIVVFLVVLLAAMVQFVAIASPILPEITVFDGGIDGLLNR